MEFQSKGKVTSVGEVLKTKENGATFVVCTVMHSDGPLAGKTYFAQRTLKNKDGVEKTPVQVGEEVQLYSQVVDGAQGRNIFTSISKGNNVDDLAGLLALAGNVQAEEIATQAIS